MEQVLQQWQQQVRQARQQGTPLRLRGGGSKDWYGQQLQGSVLDTRAWRGIVAYEPSELVVTVRAGTPLVELEQELAAHGQMLACEAPHFGAATVGGMVCAGLCGPGRERYGSLRDAVLGVSIMDGRGEILHFGGQVMKNVAGFDLARLFAGSLGVLGLLLQVSLRLQPRPQAELSLRFEMTAANALRSVQGWHGAAEPISASVWHEGQLSVRLHGGERALAAAQARLGGAQIVHAAQFWHSVREQRLPFFQQAHSLWRIACPALAPLLPLPPFASSELLEWGGAQRWLALAQPLADEAAFAQELRTAVSAQGGHVTLWRSTDKNVSVFTPLAAVPLALQRRLKQQFDPAAIFNRGRMYPELDEVPHADQPG